jgi:ADP-heptose:LPS heptosyltransferase
MLTNFPVNVKAPPAAAIIEKTGLVHGFLKYTVGTRNPRDLVSLWWTIFRWQPEVVVYLGSSRGVASAKRDATFFRLCGIRRLIGMPVVEEMQQNLWDSVEQAFEPEAVRLTRNIKELGDAQMDAAESWDLHLTPSEQACAQEAISPVEGLPILVVSVGTKMQSKDWGRENWRTLLARIASLYPNHALVLSGAPGESEISEFAAGGWREAGGGPVMNLCGLPPRESAAVYAHARLFIGHDSGPMHLAAAVQTPCVAIFAARNKPRVWFPYGSQHRVLYHKTECWGCGLETCIAEKKRCLTSITVEEVLAEVCEVLR